MADVQIDIAGEDGELTVENPTVFELRIVGCGLCLDISHEQGRSLFDGLRECFGAEQHSTEVRNG